MSGRMMTASEIERLIDKEARAIDAATRAAVYSKGVEIMAESVREVPVDTGRLRATQFLSSETSGEVVAVAGYGTDYAEPVHERPAHHEVGKIHYLSDPLDRHAARWESDIQERARSYWEKGITMGDVGSTLPKSPKDPGKKRSRKGARSKRRRRT